MFTSLSFDEAPQVSWEIYISSYLPSLTCTRKYYLLYINHLWVLQLQKVVIARSTYVFAVWVRPQRRKIYKDIKEKNGKEKEEIVWETERQ